LPDLGNLGCELRSAIFTGPLRCPVATAVRLDHEQLVGIDAPSVAFSSPVRVADMTARNEVLRGVVLLIPVEMVRDERTVDNAGPR